MNPMGHGASERWLWAPPLFGACVVFLVVAFLSPRSFSLFPLDPTPESESAPRAALVAVAPEPPRPLGVRRAVAPALPVARDDSTHDVPFDFATSSFRELDSRWASEPEDTDWTVNAATFIQAAFDGNDAGVNSAFSTRCGRTLCRAVFNARDMGLLLKLGQSESAAGVSFRYQRADVDGGSALVVMFGRPGEHAASRPSVLTLDSQHTQ